MIQRVKAVINELRPALQSDGGDIELVSVSDGVVKVRLQGACSGCPLAAQTLKYVVENLIKERVPGVKKVIQA